MTAELFREKWAELSSTTSEVDLTFLFLRIISLLGGILWIALDPVTQIEKDLLTKSFVWFSVYSAGCYVVIFFQPPWLKNIYLLSLFLDIFFLSNLVSIDANFDTSFFLGFYLLVSLHTIYFGLGFGLIVATISGAAYIVSLVPLPHTIMWTDLALRVAFLYFITVPLGLLSEKVKRDKKIVEDLNDKLEESLHNLQLTQKKLIEAEKFSALGRLSQDIAHEIRNPLTAVGGFARRLEKNSVKGSKEKEYVSIIIKEVDRLERILVDTLVYGKTVDFKLERCDIQRPIADAVVLYSEICREQGITIQEVFADGLPMVKLDSVQVQQALDSLIANAIDAMPDGGELTVQTGIEKKNETTYVTITVSDTGVGIKDEILQYIFDPYYSTKKVGKGTGLGLSIVRKIMEEHRGMVRVEKHDSSGVSFVLCFPFQSREADEMLSCWEYLRCGIETDSARHCPAYPYFGRLCWATAGSDSAGKVFGICATKIESCRQCSFYETVNNCLPIYGGEMRV